MELFEYILNSISLISGLLMVLIVSYYRYKQPDITNATSFMLSFWIGLNTLLSYSFILLSTVIGKSDDGTKGFFIRLVSESGLFLNLWASFLVACIALDLQLSFIHRIKNLQWVQQLYAPVTAAASIIPLIVTLLNPIDFKEDKDFKLDLSRQSHILNFATYFATSAIIFMTWCYTLLVAIMVLFRVIGEFWWMRKPNHSGQNINEEQRKRERQLISSVFRIMLYPIVFIASNFYICIGSALIGIILAISHKDKEETQVLVMMEKMPALKYIKISIDSLSASIGFIYLLVLLLNPVLQRAMKHSNLRQNWLPLMSQCEQTISCEGMSNDTVFHNHRAQEENTTEGIINHSGI
ncbi:uncharacterized protein VTP21DRAFT_8164 [Calcarisporiella thermophila]|uniref:uncharacterized protein n=1 Tax=Calcarisporiella thermophila TaxID=911321 RepID=UPI0037443D65